MIAERNAIAGSRTHALAAIFGLTILASAALLFLLEPMFARFVLPLLGGSPQVWNTAVVFYQLVLLVGYLYAHLGVARLSVRRQVAVHLALVLVPLALLPIALPSGWSPPADVNPIPWLLALLAVSVGLPFFVVSTTSPLLQAWFARLDHPAAADPYFLYAASNLGSLVGLLSYPLLLEPTLRLREQSALWTAGYGILVVLVFTCSAIIWRSATARGSAPPSAHIHFKGITGERRLRWVVWALIPSSLMLSVTTYMSTDIAAVPLLWIIPLALYLLSFVLAFARKPVLRHHQVMRAFRLALLLVLFLFFLGVTHIALAPVHILAFFLAAWACHSALAQDRPEARHLTEFYLWVSVGGALGGMFNTLVAPVLFDSVPEYPLVLGLVALSMVRRSDISSDAHTRRLDLALPALVGLGTVAVLAALQAAGAGWDLRARAAVLVLLLLILVRLSRSRVRFGLAVMALVLASFLVPVIARIGNADQEIYSERGFFGVQRVHEVEWEGQRYHQFFHGTTLHGMQALDPARRREPLTYFYRTGPIGQVFATLDRERDVGQVGVVGLGIGSLACYSHPDEQWTFYEIDPLVVETAQDDRFFTVLRDCAPTAEIVLGDGRLSLVREPDGRFDVLILDAYSSDSIPLHLISRESLDLYVQKLAPGGLLAYHISNRYMDVAPVLAALAADAGLAYREQFDADVSAEQAALGKTVSRWVIMARSRHDLGSLAADGRWQEAASPSGKAVWTDDFSSIVTLLRFW